ncbi:MAG: hypothetical protein ACK55I_46570, partial [bacterium]
LHRLRPAALDRFGGILAGALDLFPFTLRLAALARDARARGRDTLADHAIAGRGFRRGLGVLFAAARGSGRSRGRDGALLAGGGGCGAGGKRGCQHRAEQEAGGAHGVLRKTVGGRAGLRRRASMPEVAAGQKALSPSASPTRQVSPMS